MHSNSKWILMRTTEMVRLGGKDAPRYVTGLAGLAISLLFLVAYRNELKIVIASAFFALICATDTLESRIPNPLNLALLAAGFAYNFWASGPWGLLHAGSGCLVGLCFLLVPYLMGGVGGGDVKAFAALGSLLGPGPIFRVFLYTALFGGALAVLHYAFAHNLREKAAQWAGALRAFSLTGEARCLRPATSETLRFPYAAAIAFGFFAYIHWGGPF